MFLIVVAAADFMAHLEGIVDVWLVLAWLLWLVRGVAALGRRQVVLTYSSRFIQPAGTEFR